MTRASVTDTLLPKQLTNVANRALSPRQLDALRCAAYGYSREEAMRIMGGLALDTVKRHRAHAMQKLGARTTYHAIYIACKAGIL